MAEKRVDERWKEEIERERKLAATASGGGATAPVGPAEAAGPGSSKVAPERSPPPAARPAPAKPQAPPQESGEPEEPAGSEPNFAVFLSSLSMQAMMALGELPLPGTNQRHEDLEQARYLIDTLGLLQAKTRGNLTPEESQFLEDALCELRLRYAQRLQASIPPPPGSRP